MGQCTDVHFIVDIFLHFYRCEIQLKETMEGAELFFTIFSITIGLSVFFFILFKYLLDGIFIKLQRKQDPSKEKRKYDRLPLKYLSRENETMIGEEYESPDHDVVAVVISNTKCCVGIAAFLQERKIQYFSEKFPSCCHKDINENKARAETKTVFAALHRWGFDITRADSVHLLVDNREFSELSSNDDTLLAQKVRQYEERYVFKLTCHFIDNYICAEMSHHELWEGLIESGSKLLNLETSNTENEYRETDFVWDDFPCNEWERTQLRFKSEHFHQWPHAGEIVEEDEKSGLDEPLVDI